MEAIADDATKEDDEGEGKTGRREVCALDKGIVICDGEDVKTDGEVIEDITDIGDERAEEGEDEIPVGEYVSGFGGFFWHGSIIEPVVSPSTGLSVAAYQTLVAPHC